MRPVGESYRNVGQTKPQKTWGYDKSLLFSAVGRALGMPSRAQLFFQVAHIMVEVDLNSVALAVIIVTEVFFLIRNDAGFHSGIIGQTVAS